MARASKYHFELPIIVNGVNRRLAFAQSDIDGQWYYGLVMINGELLEMPVAGPFPSNYAAYVVAAGEYDLPDWRDLRRYGKV